MRELLNYSILTQPSDFVLNLNSSAFGNFETAPEICFNCIMLQINFLLF